MKKTIDCIKMVREIRDRHYEDNKDKSRKEIIEKYREKASKFFKISGSSTLGTAQ